MLLVAGLRLPFTAASFTIPAVPVSPTHSHPDRRATTLALRDHSIDAADTSPPSVGSQDARVDLKLLAARTRTALDARGSDAARTRLANLQSPDLWAGTVQDGVARGFAVALEEAASLCEPSPTVPEAEDTDDEVLPAKELKRRREFVVRSGKGARVRFSRKNSITLIDRRADLVVNDCIRFEDRNDAGDLDGFVPVGSERPRLFSPGFLKAIEWREGSSSMRLRLAGRLGRRADGFPCELTFEGRADEHFVPMRIRIRNAQEDHRLRIRLLGIATAVRHAGPSGWERIQANGRVFWAGTLVRACGRLQVDGRAVKVPDAQCLKWIEHDFLLGGARNEELDRAQGWKHVADPAH